jgi:speckle-type POZ protein
MAASAAAPAVAPAAPAAAPALHTAAATSLSQLPVAHEHTWELRDLTPAYFTSTVPGEKRCSPSFSALGFSWRLKVAPNGNSAALAGGVGVYLQLCSEGCTVPDVNFTLRSGEHSIMYHKSFCTDAEDSERGVATWGATCLLSHKKLLRDFDAHVPDGVLKLQVRLVSIADTPNPTTDAPGLAAAWGALLASGDNADVTLLCGDERLKAHRLVLCTRSPVFAAQLRTGPLQADASAVPVPPEITPQTLRRLLHFVYTDNLKPASYKEATHLLNAADHYGLRRLFGICERTLCAALSANNVAETLTLADQHGAAALKGAALLFMAKNAVAVTATPGWAHLQTSRPALITEALLTLATGAPPAPMEGGGADEDGGDGATRRVRPRVR